MKSLWEDLHRETVEPCGRLRAIPAVTVLEAFATLSSMSDLRISQDGERRGRGLRSLADKEVMRRHGLLPDEFACIAEIFDRHRIPDFHGLALSRVPLSGKGKEPLIGFRTFVADVGVCCGEPCRRCHTMHVLCAERARCFPTSAVVLQCTGRCRSRYYLNKMVRTEDGVGENEGHQVHVHCFYPFSSGSHPEYLSNKSGSVVMATDLIHDMAILQSTARCDTVTQRVVER